MKKDFLIQRINFLSVVIPSFNSEGSIEKLINELNSQLNLLKIKDFEIIVVNDFSNDKTSEILNNISKFNKNVKIINNHKNLGQAKSTLIGIEHSIGEVIITMDDDLQHPPEEIGILIDTLLERDYDFVIGYWLFDETFLRKITSFLAQLAFNLLNFRSFKNRDTAFRAFKVRIKKDVIKKLENHTLLDFKKVSKKYGYTKVNHNPNPLNRNYMSFKKRSILVIKYILKDTYFIYFFGFFIFLYLFFM